jgi:hypothetical protein
MRKKRPERTGPVAWHSGASCPCERGYLGGVPCRIPDRVRLMPHSLAVSSLSHPFGLSNGKGRGFSMPVAFRKRPSSSPLRLIEQLECRVASFRPKNHELGVIARLRRSRDFAAPSRREPTTKNVLDPRAQVAARRVTAPFSPRNQWELKQDAAERKGGILFGQFHDKLKKRNKHASRNADRPAPGGARPISGVGCVPVAKSAAVRLATAFRNRCCDSPQSPRTIHNC